MIRLDPEQAVAIVLYRCWFEPKAVRDVVPLHRPNRKDLRDQIDRRRKGGADQERGSGPGTGRRDQNQDERVMQPETVVRLVAGLLILLCVAIILLRKKRLK